MIRALLVLAALLVAVPTQASVCTDVCAKAPPYGRYAERAVVAAPGEAVELEVTFRNADGCGCGRTCYQLAWGYHPPHDSSAWAKIATTTLLASDGTPYPPLVCLDPQEETTAWYRMVLDDVQPEPGYVVASVWMIREGGESADWRDLLFYRLDIEGTVVCTGMSYATCKAFAYKMRPVVVP